MTDNVPVDLYAIDLPADADADSQPLVVIHGLLGSADNWRSHLKVWQRKRRVVAVDLRNHGRSPHAEGMSYSAMSQDVLAALDKLGIEQAHILGHSMGGKVAAVAALLCGGGDGKHGAAGGNGGSDGSGTTAVQLSSGHRRTCNPSTDRKTDREEQSRTPPERADWPVHPRHHPHGEIGPPAKVMSLSAAG